MAKAKAKPPTETKAEPKEKPKPTGLRLLRMKVEGLMRIIIAEIKPNGESVEVWGENGQGKSSLLNAVWIALGGKDVEPEMPVRKGAKEANIELELGQINTPELIVKYRRMADEKDEETGDIRKGKRYLDIYRPDGAKYTSPQTELNKIFGDGRMFDPLRFMNLKPAEQAAVIAKIAGIDIVAFEQRRKGLYDQRTEANRKAKDADNSLKAEESALYAALNAAGLTEAPKERVEISAAMERLKQAQEHNSNNQKMRGDLEHIQTAHNTLVDDHKKAEDDLEAVKRHANKIIADAVAKMNAAALKVDNSKRSLSDLEEKVKSIKGVQTDQFEREIAQAEPINNAFRLAESVKTAKAHAMAMKGQAKNADDRITAADEEHQNAIANAKLPIKGLTFDSTGVMLNGIPLDQEAASVQLRVSAEITAAENHTCRIMTIENASLLDQNMRKTLNEVAERMNIQLICEYVAEQHAGGIHLIEGRIAT